MYDFEEILSWNRFSNAYFGITPTNFECMPYRVLLIVCFVALSILGSTQNSANYHWYKIPFQSVEAAESATAPGTLVKQYLGNKTWLVGLHYLVDSIPPFGQLNQPKFADFYNEAFALQTVTATLVLPIATEFKSAFKNYAVQVVDSLPQLGHVTVRATVAELLQLKNESWVLFVDAPEQTPELEFIQDANQVRAEQVYNLAPQGYTGIGVNLAVGEGGAVDSVYDPDFKNRLNRTYETGAAASHKTGVAIRMAHSGNIQPHFRGVAYKANVYSGGLSFNNAPQAGIHIVNHSYGWGCVSNLSTTYNTTTASSDLAVYTNSEFMGTYSAGNDASANCNIYGPLFGTITGIQKQGKNFFTVGALSYDEEITGFSSRGPAADGRLFPSICAPGPGGTSFATPNLAGVYALAAEALQQTAGSKNSAILRAVILNSADDLGNPGPDFTHGYGRINAFNTVQAIVNNHYLTNSVVNGAVNQHTITIPAGTHEAKIMLYYHDYPAVAGIGSKTRVNDLHLSVSNASGTTFLPWVCNPYPDTDSLTSNAIRAVDSLNNIQQVTIDFPAPGTYTVSINGAFIPYGPQEYVLTWQTNSDEVVIRSPNENSTFIAGENAAVYWDASFGSTQFNLSITTDNATWQTLATNVAADKRQVDFQVPMVTTGLARIAIQRGTQTDTTDFFTISPEVTGLTRVYKCGGNARIKWDVLPGVQGYVVYKVGPQFMDSLLFTTQTNLVISGLSSTQTEYISVAPVVNGKIGRRCTAYELPATIHNCTSYDLELVEIKSPQNIAIPSCAVSNMPLTFTIRNSGINTIDTAIVNYSGPGISATNYSIAVNLNSGEDTTLSIYGFQVQSSGVNQFNLDVRGKFDFQLNNGLGTASFSTYTSNQLGAIFTQNFDNFTLCSTAWGCESITCDLSAGWLNDSNGVADQIDWRTHSGGTGTGSTGPSSDHTSGSGKYLYLEGSGNNGFGCVNEQANLLSPCIDLTQANQPQLSFWLHAYGSGIGALSVDVLSNGAWIEEIIPPIIGDQGNQWIQYTADLSDFVGQVIVIRFRGYTGGSYFTDMAIDDIKLTTLPLANFTVESLACLNQTITPQNTSAYAFNYQWQITPNTYNFMGGTNAFSGQPQIQFTDTGLYSIQLIASSIYGADTVLQQNTIQVTNNTPTLQASAPTACKGDSIQFITNATNSNWYYFNLNGTLDSSLTQQITIAADSTIVAQAVNIVNSGCQLSSNAITVAVGGLNFGWTPTTATTNYCEGEPIVLQGAPNYGLIDFYASNGTSQLQTTTWNTTAQQNTSYWASYTDSLGCENLSDTITPAVIIAPAQPIIIQLQNDSLHATVLADYYNWFLNGTLLNDSTQTIAPPSNGIYTVHAFEQQCESDLSPEFTLSNLSVSMLPNTVGIYLYPNPTNGMLTIQSKKNVVAQLKTIDGKIVLNAINLYEGETTLNLKPLSSGIYLLQIGSENFKIVKE